MPTSIPEAGADGSTADPKRIFALIIGINNYKSQKIRDLKGAVNDANAMALFLSSLHVPRTNIGLLTNEQATRQGILSAFSIHLIGNPAIHDGDTIIFFYAGHGSRVPAPSGWETGDGLIETICPHDEWIPGPRGQATPGIPDRTVNALFRELAGKKGNNITAIFDSCHSGGIGRGLGDEFRLRSPAHPCPITDPKLDQSIWNDSSRAGALAIPEGFVYRFMSSHVLLAACKQEAEAYEKGFNGVTYGVFTYALMRSLYEVPLNHITYQDLVQYLTSYIPQLSKQVPQCEGEHKDCLLFNARVPPQKDYRFSFPLRRSKSGTYKVDAGEIHGISRGTEFSIRAVDHSTLALHHIGFLVANMVHATSSTLIRKAGERDLGVPVDGARAFISNWNSNASVLKVFDESGVLKRLQTSEMRGEELPHRLFARVSTKEKADIVLWYKSQDLVIERLDPIIKRTKSVVRYTKPHGKAFDIPSILDGIALFRYHLLRYHGGSKMLRDVGSALTSKSDTVEMRLYRLARSSTGFLTPDKAKGDLFKNGQVVLKADPPGKVQKYGIEILNYSDNDLFAYLFYFDPLDYSIQHWYLPFSSQMTPPLRTTRKTEQERITVGYGAGGGDPIVFSLTNGETEETGFLKLFVSDHYVDMKHIAQAAAVDLSGTRVTRGVDDSWKFWAALLTSVTIIA